MGILCPSTRVLQAAHSASPEAVVQQTAAGLGIYDGYLQGWWRFRVCLDVSLFFNARQLAVNASQ
jgi:hypothetical protein